MKTEIFMTDEWLQTAKQVETISGCRILRQVPMKKVKSNLVEVEYDTDSDLFFLGFLISSKIYGGIKD